MKRIIIFLGLILILSISVLSFEKCSYPTSFDNVVWAGDFTSGDSADVSTYTPDKGNAITDNACNQIFDNKLNTTINCEIIPDLTLDVPFEGVYIQFDINTEDTSTALGTGQFFWNNIASIVYESSSCGASQKPQYITWNSGAGCLVGSTLVEDGSSYIGAGTRTIKLLINRTNPENYTKINVWNDTGVLLNYIEFTDHKVGDLTPFRLNLNNDDDKTIDNMFIWNVSVGDCPEVIPTANTIDIIINSPDDNFISNQNITVSYDPTSSLGSVMNCSLWINNSLDNTNLTVSSGGTYEIGTLFYSESDYSFYVNCTDGIVYNVSETRTYTYDTTNPIIYAITPYDGNNTFGNTPLTINYTCVNTNLDSFNITTYNDSSLTVELESVIHENISYELFEDDYNTFNFTDSGTKYFYAVCSDSAQETEIVTTYFYDVTDPTDTGLTNNASNPVIGNTVRFSITLNDNYDLSGYIFSQNTTGTFVNDSLIGITGTTQNINVDKTVTLPRDNYVCGKFYYFDSLSQTGESALSCYTTVNTPPTVSLTDQSSVIGVSFSYDASCDDVDSDNLTYNIDNPIAVIDSDTGLITDNPITGEEGSYIINLNCTDSTDITGGSFTYTINSARNRFLILALLPLILISAIFILVYKKLLVGN